ncbi:hypothetical protein KDL01_07925 [Actinospica durhamensis]|uniref:Uncharacterized protein n=1 Tax=Actinospica durhamensis TaxID=1508375 RepID=A0A941IQQ9_9ACTN|nr:hypothetical protein [Actinospica durhamensis]MBR7833188.1 hypothetical protein [Actinospica durhamensis]
MSRRETGAAEEPEDLLCLEERPESDEYEVDGVEWLEDEAELASRGSALPAPTTRNRLASLLLVGAVLAATALGANRVYHRDLTAQTVAEASTDTLVLAAPAHGGVSLPGLVEGVKGARYATGTGSATQQPGEPRAAVAVALVNRSPGPVTLLPGAVLLGVGLSGSSLGGSSALVLAPGQSTVLRGFVTADCAAGRPERDAVAETSLMISARTSGGGLGVGTVSLGSAGGSVRDRICLALGEG